MYAIYLIEVKNAKIGPSIISRSKLQHLVDRFSKYLQDGSKRHYIEIVVKLIFQTFQLFQHKITNSCLRYEWKFGRKNWQCMKPAY